MVKLTDIAAETGFSTYTVSCALRKCGNLSDTTRTKVLEAANRMGYRGNAAASLLAQQRNKHASKHQIKIGIVRSRKSGSEPTGFQKACDTLGYDGDIIISTDFKSPKSMLRILWNRGYAGIILNFYSSIWSEQEWLQADWNLMAAVKITRVFPNLLLNLVRHSAFDFMNFTLTETIRRGYRRIAVLTTSSLSNEDDFARMGALLAVKERFGQEGGSLELRQIKATTAQRDLDTDTINWLKSYKPDAIIGFPYNWIYAIEKAGFRIPEDIGFASPYTSAHFPSTKAVSGCDPLTEEIEFRAVQRLHRQIQIGETGTSLYFTQEVVEPIWVDCGTLPPITPDHSVQKK